MKREQFDRIVEQMDVVERAAIAYRAALRSLRYEVLNGGHDADVYQMLTDVATANRDQVDKIEDEVLSLALEVEDTINVAR